MASETHRAGPPARTAFGARVRTALALAGMLATLVALITLGYTLGSLMKSVHQPGGLARNHTHANPAAVHAPRHDPAQPRR